MKILLSDCRHALRLYLRTPGGSLTAIAVLALGMAFVGAFLSLYVDLALRPHPGFEDSSRIATIGQNTGTDLTGITYEIVARIADEMTSIDAAAMFSTASTAVGPEGESTVTALVSEGFFAGLRPRLALGRGFTDAEHAPDAEPAVVLSYSYWQQRFDGDRGVIGDFIRISRNNSPPSQSGDEETTAQFRIVGVMAETLPNIVPWSAGNSFEPALWLPLERAWPLLRGPSANLLRLGTSGTLVRRAAGAPVSAVANELRARYGDQPELWNGRPGSQLDAIGGIVGNSVTHLEARRQLELFLAASILLALVAAANVSLFLLARAPGRRRELAIRLSVGAPMPRLARQLAAESGLLVVVAAGLGLIGSIWLSLYLRGLAFLRQAEWREVTLLDWRVLGLTGAVLLLLTLFVSLSPILGLKRLGIAGASRQIAARATPAQRLAGFAQIAVAGMLGGAAIAFSWHLAALLYGDPGYATANRFMLQSFMQGPSTPESRRVELARWRAALLSIPGVTAVGFGDPVPGTEGGGSAAQIADPRNPSSEIGIYTGFLEAPFIDVLELNLLHGRAPENLETDVLVVNQTLARRLFGREDVVGERLPAGSSLRGEIIGVLEDLSFGHPADGAKPYAFGAPGDFNPIRGVIEAQLSAAELRQALGRLELSAGQMRIGGLAPLVNLRNELIAADRARGFLTIVTALLVVALTAFGFYGTQRYLVAAGRREYAIRSSLGAGPRALGRLVLLRGLRLGLPGLAVGTLLAFSVVAWLRGDFVSAEVAPASVALAVIAGLMALMLAASLAPARAARRTQPAPLLRED